HGFDRFAMPRFDQGWFRPPTANEILPRNVNAIAAKCSLLKLWIDVVRIVMLTMAAKPEQLSDDQLWPLSLASSGYNILHRLKAFAQIIPIDLVAFDAITQSLIDQLRTGELARSRCGIGILIIRNHQNQREFLDGSLIESLVKGASRSTAIADTRRPDRVRRTFEAPRQQHPIDDGDHRAQMADHRQQPFFGSAPVDVSVASPHWAQRRAKVCADRIKDV